ncbi:MAG: phosphoribosylamine--glycine ligase [Desulfobacteraceae bacterium]
MKVLVVGNGGREHALTWKIAKSHRVEKIYCAPGNAGTEQYAESVAINADDIENLVLFARQNRIDLTVVGPEAPLAGGIADRFREKGLKIFGPDKKAAQLEASKIFAKNIMTRYNIPTARGHAFTRAEKAKNYVKTMPLPLVVKADGLAAGKGVIICATQQEAFDAIDDMITKNAFGSAGAKIVIEECLQGEEASFIALTDGKTVLPLPSSQDHKRIFDDDQGPNTGGMGAYSPAPVLDYLMAKKAMKEVMEPAVKAMEKEGCPFTGVLYAGLMIDGERIKVLEFNVRLGDPETQPILMRLENDLVPLMEACVDGDLHRFTTRIAKQSTMCVVMSAGGYPGDYTKGEVITGIDRADEQANIKVFHAGTNRVGKDVTTAGGRVLGVTAAGKTIQEAMDRAYAACRTISWKECFYRKDIGAKAIARLAVKPRVGIIMGSDSDLPVMEQSMAILKKFDIAYEVTIASAHRTPERAVAFAESARKKGMGAIIAGAGHAAHLAGVLAAHTTLPVVGVPIDSSALLGMDSLLATVQMPPGIPVATMAVGKPGALNAAVFAAEILAVSDSGLADRLAVYKQEMAAKVDKKAELLG